MMDRVLTNEYRWGVSKIFELRSAQRDCLSHEQRIRLKKDGRPCPRIKYQGRTSDSVYESFSWICGGESEDGKETFFCWPCLVMGDISKVCLLFFSPNFVMCMVYPLSFHGLNDTYLRPHYSRPTLNTLPL